MSKEPLVSCGSRGLTPSTKAILRWQLWRAKQGTSPDDRVTVLFLPSLDLEQRGEEILFLKELAKLEPQPLRVIIGWTARRGRSRVEFDFCLELQLELGENHEVVLFPNFAFEVDFDLCVGVVGPRGSVGHLDLETVREVGPSFTSVRERFVLSGIGWSEVLKARAFCLFPQSGEETASSIEALSLRDDAFNPVATLLRSSETTEFSALFVDEEQLARNEHARENLQAVMEQKARRASADRTSEPRVTSSSW